MTDSTVTTLDDQPASPVGAPKGGNKSASKGAEKGAAAAAAAPDDTPVLTGSNRDAELSGDTVRLTIHPSSEEGGRDAVTITHNGYTYNIPRGKAWVVPAEVAQVMVDAVQTSYRRNEAGVVEQVDTPRFAYSIA